MDAYLLGAMTQKTIDAQNIANSEARQAAERASSNWRYHAGDAAGEFIEGGFSSAGGGIDMGSASGIGDAVSSGIGDFLGSCIGLICEGIVGLLCSICDGLG